jgi:hypothetical protein
VVWHCVCARWCVAAGAVYELSVPLKVKLEIDAVLRQSSATATPAGAGALFDAALRHARATLRADMIPKFVQWRRAGGKQFGGAASVKLSGAQDGALMGRSAAYSVSGGGGGAGAGGAAAAMSDLFNAPAPLQATSTNAAVALLAPKSAAASSPSAATSPSAASAASPSASAAAAAQIVSPRPVPPPISRTNKPTSSHQKAAALIAAAHQQHTQQLAQFHATAPTAGGSGSPAAGAGAGGSTSPTPASGATSPISTTTTTTTTTTLIIPSSATVTGAGAGAGAGGGAVYTPSKPTTSPLSRAEEAALGQWVPLGTHDVDKMDAFFSWLRALKREKWHFVLEQHVALAVTGAGDKEQRGTGE